MPNQTEHLEPEQDPTTTDERLDELTNVVTRIRPTLEGRGHMCHPEERAVLKLGRYAVGDALLKVGNILVQDGGVTKAANVELELAPHCPETNDRERLVNIGEQGPAFSPAFRLQIVPKR